MIILHTAEAFRSFNPTLQSCSQTTALKRFTSPWNGSYRQHKLVVKSSEEGDPDDTIKKYGLEAGLYKAAVDKESKVKPQDLLAKYGIAYLATSITLAIISYAICYALVSNGIDVSALLEKVGIQSSAVAANTGTFAIAYAVHKAASPIRFPPTVALTPIVAGWLGKNKSESEDKSDK